eukprot:Gregarina_sp_Poly_1__30@NODE_1006_length_5387_cov_109_543233_g27_i1_p4_GENE_NODE_1006_length_5387_cov_109_543233_g27_i1NODE_1006_length_5387_cov_109_543233_g27_i1_p4_ORF_typecomplete_len121_score16_49LIF_OSM/PF01291_17/0_021HAUS2/PF15003_6/0_21HAUS2/PF15003_6/7_7e02Opi1/PF08618_10/0_067CK2S/PF15011_6/0_32IgaA/PF07095_11/0_09Med11/PF10280_9/0_11_NODE_1006_length_5387_cov_109_543233_g27_i120642426
MPQHVTAERCGFLEEVNEHLSSILNTLARVAEQLKEPTTEDKSGDEDTALTQESNFASALNEAVQTFRTSVLAVSALCHDQIDCTPGPSRTTKANYITELAYENMKEAVSIEKKYMFRHS